ncbi:hypothetical protein V1294_006752 [Bradyrhizobium sp. AZCC 1678]
MAAPALGFDALTVRAWQSVEKWTVFCSSVFAAVNAA